MGTTSRDASYSISGLARNTAAGGVKSANHARAWKDIPAEAQPITILNFRPLFFECLNIHGGYKLSIYGRRGSQIGRYISTQLVWRFCAVVRQWVRILSEILHREEGIESFLRKEVF
jgi:hypothetical protein